MLRFLQQIINCGKDCTCSLTLSPYLQLLSGSIECVNHSEFHCPPHVIQRAANDNWFPAFSSSPSSSSSWPSGPRCSAWSMTSAGTEKNPCRFLSCSQIQCSTLNPFLGLANFVPAVAYHCCLNVPATAFSQPGNGLIAEPCSFLKYAISFYFMIFLCQNLSEATWLND